MATRRTTTGARRSTGGTRRTGRTAARSNEGEGEVSLEQQVEQLTAAVDSMKGDLDKEKGERNYYQLERDKINSFWEITKEELENLKAELRNKDRRMEELTEHHNVEIKVYKQKVKNLLFEHQNNVTQLKTESETSLKLQNDDHRGRESELRKDKRALKLELKEMELSHEDVIKSLKQEHDKNITKLRQEFERNAKELQVKYDKKTAALRNELELRRKIEIHEIEERKNTHINELMKKHEKAFSEIKNYYNDITHNNLDLIKSLKEDVAEMKRKEAQNEKLMFEIAQENKRLSEPLQRSMKEVEELRKQLANYHKDKMSLAHAKARVKAQDDSLKKTEWEHEVLQQRFATVEKERDELYDKFVNSIYDVQQKAGFKNLLLEKKLDTLGEELEKKDAQLAEVLRASNLDPASLGSITASLDAVMDEKNKTIQELQYELERVSKAHNDVIRTYEAKMHQFGIPKEELGFRPLISKTSAAPAGLVAK